MQDLLESVDALWRRVSHTFEELGLDGIDSDQELAWRVSHVASALSAARAVLTEPGVAEPLARFAVASLAREAASELVALGLIDDLATINLPARPTLELAHAALEAPRSWSLGAELDLARETFARFATEVVEPYASRVHRSNLDVPEPVIEGLAALGGFGLTIPERYGGSGTGESTDVLAMLVATEELSRASLGIGGSLITRPEIIARALLAGGTEEQRATYLPALASGEIMGAVAVTEPDYGSDVASIATRGVVDGDSILLRGVKTWCTFAGRAELLAVLVRTEPDPALRHRGLSLVLVDKPRCSGHSFELDLGGGRLVGRAIDTLGYRGMHSFELSFDDVRVERSKLVGGDAGRGRGFYLQMSGFENGRLQTVARAIGLMEAALDAAHGYAAHRRVFGHRLLDYSLSVYKLARMAGVVAAARALAYRNAADVGTRGGSLAASMAKAWACRQAEWVTREAMQLHGGMGYAEEYPVSRDFVHARVLSIFEGSDETLSLRVVARALATQPRVAG